MTWQQVRDEFLRCSAEASDADMTLRNTIVALVEVAGDLDLQLGYFDVTALESVTSRMQCGAQYFERLVSSLNTLGDSRASLSSAPPTDIESWCRYAVRLLKLLLLESEVIALYCSVTNPSPDYAPLVGGDLPLRNPENAKDAKDAAAALERAQCTALFRKQLAVTLEAVATYQEIAATAVAKLPTILKADLPSIPAVTPPGGGAAPTASPRGSASNWEEDSDVKVTRARGGRAVPQKDAARWLGLVAEAGRHLAVWYSRVDMIVKGLPSKPPNIADYAARRSEFEGLLRFGAMHQLTDEAVTKGMADLARQSAFVAGATAYLVAGVGRSIENDLRRANPSQQTRDNLRGWVRSLTHLLGNAEKAREALGIARHNPPIVHMPAAAFGEDNAEAEINKAGQVLASLHERVESLALPAKPVVPPRDDAKGTLRGPKRTPKKPGSSLPERPTKPSTLATATTPTTRVRIAKRLPPDPSIQKAVEQARALLRKFTDLGADLSPGSAMAVSLGTLTTGLAKWSQRCHREGYILATSVVALAQELVRDFDLLVPTALGIALKVGEPSPAERVAELGTQVSAFVDLVNQLPGVTTQVSQPKLKALTQATVSLEAAIAGRSTRAPVGKADVKAAPGYHVLLEADVKGWNSNLLADIRAGRVRSAVISHYAGTLPNGTKSEVFVLGDSSQAEFAPALAALGSPTKVGHYDLIQPRGSRMPWRKKPPAQATVFADAVWSGDADTLSDALSKWLLGKQVLPT